MKKGELLTRLSQVSIFCMWKVYLVALFIFCSGSLMAQTVIFPFDSDWKYKDDGSDQGTAWSQTGFDDSGWSIGVGQFGYGSAVQTTILDACGTPTRYPACMDKYIGYYFRKTVVISDVSLYKSFTFDMYRDDGVVIYVNGIEVYRNNMPTGTISYNTLASTAASDGGTTINSVTITLASSQLISGTNVIAAEVHQNSPTSSDLTWDMRLTANPVGVPVLTTGPYLQKATSTSMLVRWYTDEAVDGKVMYGTSPGNLSQSVTGPTTTDHSVQLTGLTPYTKYYYSIGSSSTTLQSGSENYFLTSPLPNSNTKYTFWVTGDMGDGSMRQINVLNAYNTYMGSRETNGWISLGDNAYTNGTVDAFSSNFFDIYESSILRKAPFWPATGNHDYANSVARQIDHNIPYFDFFDLPTNGEAGGVPSNSEAYYSFNYGDIHFVALDSYIIENGSYRLYDLAAPQMTWLQQDLALNTKKWTIVYFHHPPYTMGSHNSDTESELLLLRQNLVPILEQYDVDLVMSGHSHSYERSKLQKDHFGFESTFDPAVHQISQSSGKYDGTANSCVYTKDSPAVLGGTVYLVAGSAGRLDPGQATFPHAAMYYGNDDISGSMILEIENNRLDGKWLSSDGVIRDNFTIMKEVNKVNNIDVIAGESVTMSASWVGQYDWSTGQTTRNLTVTPASSTTYTVTDNYTCITDTYNLNVIGASLTIDIPSIGFSQICAGSNVSIAYTISGTFNPGNVFTLQMSNSSGSFASPVAIGTLASTTSGTINGVIPSNTSSGSNYRFRVVSSNPVFTGATSGIFTVDALPLQKTISDPSTCTGTAVNITLTASTTGVNYQLRLDSNDSNVGTAVAGTGGTISFSVSPATTTIYNVLATVAGTSCSLEMTDKSIVTVNSLPAQKSVSDPSTCNGTAVNISLTGSVSGVNYQLRLDSNDSNVGTAVAGTGGTISFSVNPSVTTTYNVLATVASTSCSLEMTDKSTVTVNALPAQKVVSDPTTCIGTAVNISLTGSVTGVNYQLRLDSDNSNVGSAVAGTGGTILFSVNPSVTTTYNVLATVASTSCNVEMTDKSIVTVNALPVQKVVSDPSTCYGTSVNVTLTGSVTGVNYQLRLDSDNSNVGTAVAGTGGTIAFSVNPSVATTYNVLATVSATSCSIEMTDKSIVTVNALPAQKVLSDPSTCSGTSVNIALTGSVTGVNYQLRLDSDNSNVGTAVAGTGGTITFSVNPSVTTTYNVLATVAATSCNVEMTDKSIVTVNALPAQKVVSDPNTCIGTAVNITLTGSVTGVNYQLRLESDNSNVGTAVAGTGGTITFSVNPSVTTTYNVLATVAATSCSLEMTDKSTVTVNALPASPTVSNVTYCQNTAATSLTAIALANHTLQWYGTNATGGTASTTAPTPSTSAAGTTIYYVSQENNTTGCESPRAAITVTINGLPSLPVVTNVSYCLNATATVLTATATSGNSLQWYGTNSTGGTASTVAPVPLTNTAGTTTYYVSQKNNTTNCESARASITVTVNALPGLPGVSDYSYCQNSIATQLTATATSGHTLRWYGTNATGGTASTIAPTPATSVVGSTNYYVSQINTTTGCEGARAEITVAVINLPPPPVVSDISYCQNAVSTALTATTLASHELLWYGTNATGGTASTTAPIPSTSAIGITDYYVSQRSTLPACNGESPRAKIRVTVNAIPSQPAVSNIDYCRGTTASPLTATALTGHTLQWYGTNSTGGTATTTAPTPSTVTVGTTTYYVSQKNNTTGCEGVRASILVTINSTPPAPDVTDISYCQNAAATPLTATADAGHTLLWYGTNATGGTSSTTAPTPSTASAGVVNYYVSQRKVGEDCEGPRASIAVTITSTAPPIITATGIGTADVMLSSSAATGNQWFKDGVPIPGATASTYAVMENGVFQVKGTNGSCITSLSEALTVIITDVKESGLPVQLIVFPVPAREAISIHLTGVSEEEIAEVMVIDKSGRVVARQKMRGKESTLIIEEYPVGDYFIRITNQSFLLHSRFVKY